MPTTDTRQADAAPEGRIEIGPNLYLQSNAAEEGGYLVRRYPNGVVSVLADLFGAEIAALALAARPAPAAEGGKAPAPGDVLTELRYASIARQIEWSHGSLEPLPILFQATELGGEAGEVLNVVKKLERERLGWTGSRATVQDLKDELADLVICADLVADAYGINLAEAIGPKFNATSDQRELKTRMGEPDALASLVSRFADALLKKLRLAEEKYRHENAWQNADWHDSLRQQLEEHVAKGDPLDVAAYAAFAWHHGWSVSPADPAPKSPAPAAESKPVAWRVRDRWERQWKISWQEPIGLWDDMDPLYLAPPAASGSGDAVREAVSEDLWCVHVIGPDDLYPALDIVTAARWAAACNDVARIANQDVSDDDYVLCHANIEPWSGTAEEHASGLAHAVEQMTPPCGVIPPGQVVEIDYTNHRGERAIRKIKPTGRMLVGFDAWHPDAPWLIEARDVERGVIRTFDPARIHRWGDRPAADARQDGGGES